MLRCYFAAVEMLISASSNTEQAAGNINASSNTVQAIAGQVLLVFIAVFLCNDFNHIF
jgi:hypothetical protein